MRGASLIAHHNAFLTSNKFECSLLAASTSSGDATATTTPLSLTASSASANSLKSASLVDKISSRLFCLSSSVTPNKYRNKLLYPFASGSWYASTFPMVPIIAFVRASLSISRFLRKSLVPSYTSSVFFRFGSR
nr:hypothetical protein Iba_chr14dCG9500 [Ipomoea batatas]